MDMDIEIDLNEVASFVKSSEFHEYLLYNAPSFETAAYILQTLLDAVDTASKQVDNGENI